jgi:ABC-type antimicrobial peptide transport system permease subunit
VSEVLLDGVSLSPFRDNQYMIPAGQHEVGLSQNVTNSLSPHQFFPHIMSITGNLLSYSYAMRTVTFEYESDGRCLVSVSSEPHTVTVDGAVHTFYPMRGDDCYSLFLPAGRHTVEIVAGDSFSYGINVTSFWSTTAIVLFGALAVIALAGMYTVVRVQRRALRVSQGTD